MKKRKILLLLIQVFLFSPILYAAPINSDTALKIADHFMFGGNEELLNEHDRRLLNLNQIFVINYAQEGQSKGFVVVAGDDSLPSPVLAFSKKGGINIRNTTMQSILEQYCKEIMAYRQGKVQSATEDTIYYRKEYSSRLPLLGDIAWNQSFPYNQLAPKDIDGKKSLVGCTAVAMAEIMKYYQYPVRGAGENTYKRVNKKGNAFSVTVSYDSLHIDWSTMANSYDHQDSVAASTSVCPLLYHCAVSTEANFASDVTEAFIDPATTALFKHFNYHPAIRRITSSTLPDAQLQQLLYREVEAGRPVLCCGHSHFFVCDGFTDDYFHFNWGWGGDMNGYFKLSALKAGVNNFKIIDYMTVNIRPQNNKEVHKAVRLLQPGTLHQQISDDEVRTLTSLTITGKLNGKDFYLLRKMAGAIQTIWEKGGELRSLDLSKAEIVDDPENFYYMRHHTTANVIGENMFKDCTNIQKLILPEQVIELNLYAFMNCASLQFIQLPPKIRFIQSKVWLDCVSMKAISVHPSNPYYADKDGVLYSKDFKTLLCYPPYKSDSIYVVPESTQKIYPFAFHGNLLIQSVQLSGWVKEIPPFTFSSCPSLRSVRLPESVELIEPNAFTNCKELTEVNLPTKFQAARESIFVQCNQLK